MPRVTWDDSFSVNVAKIDAQHKKWFSLINALYDTLMDSDQKNFTETTEKTLKEMIDYVRHHFSYEEQYMQEIGFPTFAEHKRLHDNFYVRVKEYYADAKEGRLVLNTTLMSSMMNWLEYHIKKEDRKYRDFAESL